jgi:hypothetical protein
MKISNGQWAILRGVCHCTKFHSYSRPALIYRRSSRDSGIEVGNQSADLQNARYAAILLLKERREKDTRLLKPWDSYVS